MAAEAAFIAHALAPCIHSFSEKLYPRMRRREKAGHFVLARGGDTGLKLAPGAVEWRPRLGRLDGREISAQGPRDMGKGDKQRGNREAKKPKANKKVAPGSSTFLKPRPEAPKPGAKPAPK